MDSTETKTKDYRKTVDYSRSIELLNRAVGSEIATSLQYIYFHVQMEDAGYKPLADLFRRLAIVEMRHIELLSERILFLRGEVDMNAAFRTKQLSDPTEMVRFAEQLELLTVNQYNEWSHICAECLDAGSHRLFETLIVEEESHQDTLRTEGDNIEAYGREYLSLSSFDNLRTKSHADD